MSPAALLLVVPLAVLLTATLSGTFGMGGGMLLMGVYAALLPVRTAMVLHGVTQLASNGSRTVLFLKHVHWRGVGFYLVGAAVSVAVCTALALAVDRGTLFLVLALFALGATALPSAPPLRFESAPHAVLCGVLVMAAQLTAGVSGPILDVFFVRGDLDRHAVIGTKAFTQTLGHLLKLVYFTALLAPAPDEVALPWWIYPVVAVAAVGGSLLGKQVLRRLAEERFRALCTRLVQAVGVVYLVKAIHALAL